jgi:hypothetical protein
MGRVRYPFFFTLLLSAVAVACAVRMATVTGPDGNPWLTCDGNDAKCIEATGAKCPNGYVVGQEKMFNCNPKQADDQGPCVTDKELETTEVFAIDELLENLEHLEILDCLGRRAGKDTSRPKYSVRQSTSAKDRSTRGSRTR